MRVEEIMKPAQSCKLGNPVRECASLMRTENIGFVPVCNDAGEAVGTITDRDIAIRVVAEGRSPDTRIDDVMTKEVVSCKVGDDLGEAERLMREKHKSRMMVCDDGGKLVGVISLSDIADIEEEGTAAHTFREVASRESQQPHAS